MLELNVLNVQDIDRELKKLAANIEDPRAQKWLLRVARHFIVNIDQLLTQPYRAKAEPRSHNSSKYYYSPKGGWQGQQAPEEPADKSKWWGEKPMAGDPNACPQCGGSGKVWFSSDAAGKPEPHPWTTHDPEDKARTCPVCRGTGKRVYPKAKGREGFFPESRDLTEAGRKKKLPVDAPPEVYEPDPPGVYTSRLHEPVVQRDIDQNFSPYTTKKAPKKGIFGGPPSAEVVEPWVKDREKEQDIHHFDPIQTRRRELWLRLESFVNYSNWMSGVLAKKGSEKPNEQVQAKNAELFFRRLETMHTGDVDGFRAVMREANDFKDDVQNRPWIYMDDPKLISEAGNYKLVRASLWQTVYNLSNRDGYGGQDPSWCTNTEHHAKSYSKQGPLYFCDKDGKPYVLVHFESTQAKNLSDSEIDAKVAAEIAPLFIDPKRFPIGMFDSARSYGGGGIKLLGEAVAKLRRAQGIRG